MSKWDIIGKIKSIMVNLMKLRTEEVVRFERTKYPYVLEGSDGKVYYSETAPKFLLYPGKPYDKIIINGLHLTLNEFEFLAQNTSVIISLYDSE